MTIQTSVATRATSAFKKAQLQAKTPNCPLKFKSKVEKKYQLGICYNLKDVVSSTQVVILSHVLNIISNSKHDKVYIKPSSVYTRLCKDKSFSGTYHKAMKKAVDIGLLSLDETKGFKRYSLGEVGNNSNIDLILTNYLTKKQNITSKPKGILIEIVDVRDIPLGQKQIHHFIHKIKIDNAIYSNAVGNDGTFKYGNYTKLAKKLGCARQTAKKFINYIVKAKHFIKYACDVTAKATLEPLAHLKHELNRRATQIKEKLEAKKRKQFIFNKTNPI